MMPLAPSRRCWLVVILFAVAMAWVEAASVDHIRVVVDRIVPYQQNPLPVGGVLGAVELVREASTLIMLLTVGILAGRAWHERLGYSALAFGVWDILYYVFLRVMSGWPTSLLDWDVLFLLPLPWWGPVLAPVSIALLMVVWGTLVTQSGDRIAAPSFLSVPWALGALGIVLALYVFMSDAIQSLPLGHEATRQVLPTAFNWPLFGWRSPSWPRPSSRWAGEDGSALESQRGPWVAFTTYPIWSTRIGPRSGSDRGRGNHCRRRFLGNSSPTFTLQPSASRRRPRPRDRSQRTRHRSE